jgi:putative PEP-CTERM system TPR-repeat lipoprotein
MIILLKHNENKNWVTSIMNKIRTITIFLIQIAVLLTAYTANAEKNHYEAALQAYNRHDIETAYIHLKNALQQSERKLPARILFSKVLINKHLYEAAERQLNELIEQGVDYNLIVFPLGEIILNRGEFEQALIYADNMALNKEGLLAYNHIKARAYISLDNLKNAEIEYQGILTRKSNDLEALLGLATVYFYQKENAKAKAQLTKANEIAPKNEIVWQLKGHLARSESQFNEAINYLTKANELGPKNIETLRILIGCYVDIKSFVMANRVADKALEIAKNDPQTTFMKALILKELNQPKLSKELLTQLSNQLSQVDESYLVSRPQLLLLDAMTSYAQESWIQAESKFKRYLSHTSTQTEMSEVMLLADVYQQLQEPKRALVLLETNERKLIFNKQYALILAGLYLKFNQNFKADFVLSKLRVDYPKDEAVLILTANLLEDSGRIKQALALLENAGIKGGENYQYALTLLSLRVGDFQKSLNYIEPLTDIYPDNISYHLIMAQILVELKQNDKAQKIIEDLYVKQPENSEVSTSYALLQYNTGKLGIAKKVLTDILNKNGNNTQSALLLAKVEYKLGNKEAAILELERQARISSLKAVALAELADIYISEQNWQAALSVVEKILRDDRLNVQSIFKKSEILISLKHLDETKEQLDLLAGLVGKNAFMLVKLSKLQFLVEDFSGAEYSLQEAFELSPNSLSIAIELIKIKIQRHKVDEAIELLADIQETTHQDNVDLSILQGDIFYASNKSLEAFNAYLNAVKKEHNNLTAIRKLYQISQSEYLSVKFIDELSTLVTQNPELLLHRHLLADHLFEHKHFKNAKYQYLTLLKNNIPTMKRAIVLNSLATIYIQDSNLPMAIKTSKQALTLNPAAPAILDTVGWVLVLSEKLDLGLTYLRQAFSLSSTSPDIQYHIAYTLAKQQRVDEAKKLLTKLIALPDNFEEYELSVKLFNELSNN